MGHYKLKNEVGDIMETAINGARFKFFSPASVVLYTFPPYNLSHEYFNQLINGEKLTLR